MKRPILVAIAMLALTDCAAAPPGGTKTQAQTETATPPAADLRRAEAQESVASSEAPSGPGLQGRMPEPQTRAYRACTSDAQCTYVQNGCCDCANGGQDFAVARDQVSAFRAQFQCTGQCTEMYRECRKGKIACEQGVCVYHEPGAP